MTLTLIIVYFIISDYLHIGGLLKIKDQGGRQSRRDDVEEDEEEDSSNNNNNNNEK